MVKSREVHLFSCLISLKLRVNRFLGYSLPSWFLFFSLSGLSPFMGDNDTETMNNILHTNWDFDADAFENVSEEAKDFISSLLVSAKWYSSIHPSLFHKCKNLKYRIYHKSYFLSHILQYRHVFYYFSSFLATCLVALRASLFSFISQSLPHFDLLSFP